MTPHLQCCVSSGALAQEGHGPGASAEEATKWIRGMEHLSYEAERSGIVQLGKEKVSGPNCSFPTYKKGVREIT